MKNLNIQKYENKQYFDIPVTLYIRDDYTAQLLTYNGCGSSRVVDLQYFDDLLTPEFMDQNKYLDEIVFPFILRWLEWYNDQYLPDEHTCGIYIEKHPFDTTNETLTQIFEHTPEFETFVLKFSEFFNASVFSNM